MLTKKEIIYPILLAITCVIVLVFGVSSITSNEQVIDYVTVSIIFLTFWKFGWLHTALISTSISQWNLKWTLATIPFIIIIAINIIGIDWTTLNFSMSALVNWSFNNFGIGLYEEFLMRALAMYILLRSWGNTRKGVVLACIVQALIFGLLHFKNLGLGAEFSAVTAQVVYASLVGMAFGALMLAIRTIWIGVILHGLVDAAGSISVYFGSVANDLPTAASFGELAMQVAVVFILTIPITIICLKHAPVGVYQSDGFVS